MSSESLAALRRTAGNDLKKLAEEHIQHDLTSSDRDLLKSTAQSFSTHTLVGSLIGLSLGAYLSIRLRQNRYAMFSAFRTVEKPTHLRFANGREEAIPDITPLLRPSRLGDFATYTFFAAGGLLLGGELGLLTGGWSARRGIESDPVAKGRIETAFRRFRVDVLKREIQELEKGEKGIDL